MKSRKPAWWQLYLLFPLMFVLLGAEHFLPVPGVSADLADSGIVVFTFVAMLTWVQFNGGLLEHFDFDPDDYRRNLKITIYEPNSMSKDGREQSAAGDDQEERYEPATRKNGHRQKTSVQSAGRPSRLPGKSIESDFNKEEEKWFLN